MLTPKQLDHFKVFGFIPLRKVLDSHKLEELNREFQVGMEIAYPHVKFDGTQRHWTTLLSSQTPAFSSLLEDPRFCEVAEQLFGLDTFAVTVDGNRYVGNTPWHPDTRSQHQYGVKFAIYLDPVDATTGALRVIPGSHHKQMSDELHRTLRKMELPIEQVPSHVCDSTPGDVVAFDLRLWHGSFGGSNDRRMCTLVYYKNPKNPDEEQAARDIAKVIQGTAKSMNDSRTTLYHPDWLNNTGQSPRRSRWIGRLRELGFLAAS